MNGNPVGCFEIYVQDMQRAKQFYETVLKLELTKLASPTEQIEMFAFPMDMEASGASEALAKAEGCPSGGLGTLVYFSCGDCANEASWIEAAGGKIFKPKMPIGQYGFIALATDADGNMFGFHSLA